ncbi:hypothetical protein M2444_006177 [Paenibacillus sp. PastF-3]|uniref:hypothetical protein n=1 Tax=Paenibacillus sp. PastF-3 TaxID=2940626 RepID=UPI002473855E|nr:hypothetical protein [Paenibacillus sp. PastF-3]MDH6374327.1 hypothetical protein [Paenibacillus sp. PastF-3]
MNILIQRLFSLLDFIQSRRGVLGLIFWACVIIFNHEGHSFLELVFVFLFFAPLFLLVQPKLIFSNNIACLSTISFLSVPIFITVIAVFVFQVVTIQLLLISICGTSTLMYLILLIRYKICDVLLDNLKISFDIIRTMFAISLGFITIYSLSHNDFSFFEKIIVDYENKNVDDLKKIFQLMSQSISLPFVISSSIFKILTDWLVLMKKRGNLQTWYSKINNLLIYFKNKLITSFNVTESKHLKE